MLLLFAIISGWTATVEATFHYRTTNGVHFNQLAKYAAEYRKIFNLMVLVDGDTN